VIFRKVALERLSSPEQLDQLVQVTDPRGWLALTGLSALLLAAVGWGIWGSIPTESRGEGMLLRKGGVSSIVSAANGQVEEILVTVGQVIKKGEAVATVRQEALSRQIRDNQSRLAALRAEYANAVRSASQQKQLRARDLAQQRANLEQSIDTLKKELALLQQRVEAEKSLLDDGLITKQAYLTTQQTLNAKQNDLASQELERSGLDLKTLEADQQLDQQLEARETAIRELDLATRELQAKLGETVNVFAESSGRVLEIVADRGAVVVPGTPLLSVEDLSEELRATLFVPASAGKKVQKGMRVRIAPSTVKREEYGALLGRVAWAAEYPATSLGMTRQLKNETLVAKLMEQGPLIQVDVDLLPDEMTPTGYRWSSSHGPNLKITSGTLASGDIVVKEDRPISLVIPTLREKLGL
jgi:HlyD family secretion protein